ncbi:MAG: type II toxin-antitoxin system RatA family toxin [Bdellovibrionia bacterium]
MPRIEIRKIITINKDRLFQTVFRYQDYPKFVYGLKSVRVVRTGTNRARVTYQLALIKNIVFTLDHIEDKHLGTIQWSLVKSNFFDTVTGHWKVKDLGPGRCEVEYMLELESKTPIPRLILYHLIKRVAPAILNCFEKQARSACC